MTEVIYETVEVIAVSIRITPAVEKHRDELLAAGKCLGCERKVGDDEPVRCGQCPACYSATLRAIGRRIVTRNELIREGKLLKATKGGRPAKNDYTKSLGKRSA